MSSTFPASATPYAPSLTSFTHDTLGNRKYTTNSERKRFILAARAHPTPEVATFCLVLTFTGARISEVLALTPRQIDPEAGVVTICCLKKHRSMSSTPVYRVVPIPPSIMGEVDAVHAIRAKRESTVQADTPIWSWCRTTAWKRVKETMQQAEITGAQATPKGLRHGFAVGALITGVPITTVMRWLGHARLETTMIYTNTVGAEAESLARRMWKPLLHLSDGA